jgi:hypothetical protein
MLNDRRQTAKKKKKKRNSEGTARGVKEGGEYGLSTSCARMNIE